jgi:hypothetical protein
MSDELKVCHRCKIKPNVLTGMFFPAVAEKKEQTTYLRIYCSKCGYEHKGAGLPHDELYEDVSKHWNYWNTHFFYMEDVHDIALDAMELIETRLKEYGIVLTDAQVDRIYCPMEAELETYSNGEYNNYN